MDQDETFRLRDLDDVKASRELAAAATRAHRRWIRLSQRPSVDVAEIAAAYAAQCAASRQLQEAWLFRALDASTPLQQPSEPERTTPHTAA